MKADIATEVSTDDFSAGVFVETTNRVAHDAGIEMADVKDLERIRITEFADDGLILISGRSDGGIKIGGESHDFASEVGRI